MPYTQAFPLKDSVDSAIKAKVDLLNKRGREGSDVATYYYTNRAPWISMTSAVDVTGAKEQRDLHVTQASQLARDYKLTSAFEQDSLPAGHSVSQQLGIRPRPGIQNMSIQSHNQFGSLRTARVSFQVWSKEDLDACEVLYMRPGMSVLLEWGWSLYLKGEGENITVHPMERGYNLFDTNKRTLIGILQDLEKLKINLGHGYDAIFGFVKNFSWKLRPDGGYDCSTEIMSPGELVESLNVARPISDIDASLYTDFFQNLATQKFDEADRAPTGGTQQGAAGEPGIARHQVYQENVNSLELNETKERLLADAKDFSNSIVNFEEQTALMTLLEWDLKYFGIETLYNLFGEQVENNSGLWQLNLINLPRQALFAKRLAQQSDYRARYQNMLQINWNDPTYALDEDGNKIVGSDGKFEIEVKEINTQYYVKLGYLLEVMNEFMLRSSSSLIASFDLLGRATFSYSHQFNLSLDPSVCILPGDLLNIEKNNKIKLNPGDDNLAAQFLNPNGLDPNSPLAVAARGTTVNTGQQDVPGSPEAQAQQDPVVDIDNTILDTYMNVEYVIQLLKDSQISQVTKDGIPVARMFSFVEGLLSGINGACAGLSDISLQYYETEAKYSVIDRKTFSKAKQSSTFLDLIGLKSLFHSFDVSSALTPELASSIAISAQAKVRSTDSTAAGFLRFNHGIEDRILTDRKLLSSVVNPQEIYTETTDEDKQRVLLLYQGIYGSLTWLPSSFRYARELYHEYVNEHFVQGENSVTSRIVIPFIASFELDGTSGFNILNSFRVSEELLPYSYNYIKGGIGMIVTGIEASVDPSKWTTRLKAQMYPLASGELPVENAIGVAPPKEDLPTENYVVDYANEVVTKALLTPELITSGTTVRAESRDGLSDLVNDEYGSWQKGTKTELQDRGSVKQENIVRAGSRQYAYWKEIDQYQPLEWFRAQTKPGEAEQTVAWSAAYISYIIKKGLLDPTWPNAAAHKQYVDAARANRYAGNAKGWMMYSLKYDDNVVAEVGDVLVAPRDGGYNSSHGIVVFTISPPGFQIRNRYSNMGSAELPVKATPYAAAGSGNASIAGGDPNHGTTNRIRTIDLEEKSQNGVTRYVYKKNTLDKGYLLVIKRM